jgi:foldase protein PrsA
MKALRIALLIALSVVLAVSVAGCGTKNAAAKVNGQTIPLDELNKQMDQLKKQYPQMFTGADGEGRLLEFKQRLLDNLINQVLIKQEAKKRGITVSDAEIKKQIDQLKTGFKDDAAFQEALKTAGMDPSTLEGQVRDQLVTQKLIESLAKDITVTDAEIKAYYDKNKSQFAQPAQKRASHILFKPEDKAKAEKILKEVLAGGNFAALAKANSTDPGSAAKGGDLGWPTTPYVPEFEAAVKKLAKGQTTTELVKTQFGWHIIRVTDERAASQKTLEQAKADIKNIIIQQRRADAYAKLLEKLRKDAKIEILVQDLKAKQNTGK